jgi:hypothetical protein
VSEDFFNSSVTYNAPDINSYDFLFTPNVLDVMHGALLNGTLKNMTSSQCKEAYGINFVSKSRNVLLVTTDANSSNNSLLYVGTWDPFQEVPYAWICAVYSNSLPCRCRGPGREGQGNPGGREGKGREIFTQRQGREGQGLMIGREGQGKVNKSRVRWIFPFFLKSRGIK